MKTLLLNNELINKLLKDRYLKLNSEEYVQILDNQIILNSGGELYNTDSLNINFQRREYKNNSKIKMLQNLVCNHLNLNPDDVICTADGDMETEFLVRFLPDIEIPITICNESCACLNTNEMYSGSSSKPVISDDQIGIYRKLMDSQYYFRWIPEENSFK